VALHNLKAAQKEYQDLQPKASQLRVEFLQQKLVSPCLSDKNQQAISCILTAEQSRETFYAIWQLKNIQPMCSVSQIEVPGPDGPLHITSQQEVEQHLSQALALHFQLTAHSPFWLTPSVMSWTSLGPPWLLKLSYMAPANAQQRLTFTPSSPSLSYRFPQGHLLSPQELAMMTSSATGDGPGNVLPHPTLGSTMATTRQV